LGCSDKIETSNNESKLLKERIGRLAIIDNEGPLYNDTIRFEYDSKSRVSSIIRLNDTSTRFDLFYENELLNQVNKDGSLFRRFVYKEGRIDTIHIEDNLRGENHHKRFFTDFSFEGKRISAFSSYYVQNDTLTVNRNEIGYDFKGNIKSWRIHRVKPFYIGYQEISFTKFSYDNMKSPITDFILGLAFYDNEINTFSFMFFNKNNLKSFDSDDHFQHWGSYELEYWNNDLKYIWFKNKEFGHRYDEINLIAKFNYYSE
jgi:hypothetical protein